MRQYPAICVKDGLRQLPLSGLKRLKRYMAGGGTICRTGGIVSQRGNP